MVEPEQTSQLEAEQKDPAEGRTDPSVERARAVFENLQAAGPDPGQKPEGGEQAPESIPVLAGKVQVDWGDGLQREVDVADLVKMAKGSEQAGARAAAAELLNKNLGGAQTLLDRIESGGPQFQQEFQNLMNGQPAPAAHPPPERSLEQEMTEAIGGPTQNGTPDESAWKRQMTEAMLMLVQREGDRETKDTQVRLTDRVDQVMSSYPVFQEDPQGAKFDRDAIMNKIALGGSSADVDAIVASTAVTVHERNQRLRGQASVRTRGVEKGPEELFIPEKLSESPGQSPSDVMMSGGIREQLLGHLHRQR